MSDPAEFRLNVMKQFLEDVKTKESHAQFRNEKCMKELAEMIAADELEIEKSKRPKPLPRAFRCYGCASMKTAPVKVGVTVIKCQKCGNIMHVVYDKDLTASPNCG
jgi:peptide subunit release factor 1 (eRF1)